MDRFEPVNGYRCKHCNSPALAVAPMDKPHSRNLIVHVNHFIDCPLALKKMKWGFKRHI